MASHPAENEVEKQLRPHADQAALEDTNSHQTEARSSDNTLQEPDEHIYVEFVDGDPHNPLNWPKRKKWIITLLASWLTILAGWCGTTFPVGIPSMQAHFHTTHEVSVLALGIYLFGFAIAPLVTAPLSEVYGRQPLFIVSTILFAILLVPTALSPSMAGVIICRFLTGCVASTGSTVVGGVISDIWATSERGHPMSVFSTGAFLGTSMSVASFSFVGQNLGWRWVQYIQIMMVGSTVVLVLLIFRETRDSAILSKRAAKLRRETDDMRYACRADEERASLSTLVKISLFRPLRFLATEPVVIAMSLFIAFAWAVLWGLLEAVILVFENAYDFSLGQAGLTFWALVVGALCAQATNLIQERLYKANVHHRGPEARLYFSCVGGVSLVIGGLIFSFGQGRAHWIVPCVGLSFIMHGVWHIYCSVFCYLADTYMLYASSAIAAQSFARNLVGGCFPLFMTQMYNNLGFTWASFLISMLGLLLACIPFFLFFKGKAIRKRSKVVQQVLVLQAELAERQKAQQKDTAHVVKTC